MSQASATVPISMDEAGVFRVAETRVSLDSVIHAFDEGATPEEIVQQYPTLDLTAIYSVITYYLQNQAEIKDYLDKREIQRQDLKNEIETRFKSHGLRERLLSRKQ